MEIFLNVHKDFDDNEFSKAFPTQTLAMAAARENKKEGFTTTVSKVTVKKMPAKALICDLLNDGGEFGMGAEMGISTDKLHARGPMGLEELTSYKYVVLGNGQVRG